MLIVVVNRKISVIYTEHNKMLKTKIEIDCFRFKSLVVIDVIVCFLLEDVRFHRLIEN